jgi:glycosyltransferase involved in cell wall biosynthesis
VPAGNLAARIVSKTGAGVVVLPDDEDGFVREAAGLLESPARRMEMAHCGRSYAEKEFDVLDKRTRFEALLKSKTNGQ